MHHRHLSFRKTRFLSLKHFKLLPVSYPWLWGFRRIGSNKIPFCFLSFSFPFPSVNRPQLSSCVEAASWGPGSRRGQGGRRFLEPFSKEFWSLSGINRNESCSPGNHSKSKTPGGKQQVLRLSHYSVSNAGETPAVALASVSAEPPRTWRASLCCAPLRSSVLPGSAPGKSGILRPGHRGRDGSDVS